MERPSLPLAANATARTIQLVPSGPVASAKVDPMLRAPRTSRTLKNAGVIASIVILSAWVLSLCWAVGYGGVHGKWKWSVVSSAGGVRVSRSGSEPGGWQVTSSPWQRAQAAWTNDQLRVLRRSWLGLRMPEVFTSESFGTRGRGQFHVWVPFWLPFFLVILPTVLFWWLGRRQPMGFCRSCGYNLTGNVSGVCPECGRAVP